MVHAHYFVLSFGIVRESHCCESFFREHGDCLIIIVALVNTWGARQEVCGDVSFARDVLQHKVVILKPLELARFPSIQVMGFLVVEQILMICLHYYLVSRACEVQSPMRQGLNYRE